MDSPRALKALSWGCAIIICAALLIILSDSFTARFTHPLSHSSTRNAEAKRSSQRSVPESLTVREEAQSVARALEMFDRARTLLLSQQLGRAERAFILLWESIHEQSSAAMPEHCVAFYLGMIARSKGDLVRADEWFRRAATLALHQSGANSQEAQFYRTCAALLYNSEAGNFVWSARQHAEPSSGRSDAKLPNYVAHFERTGRNWVEERVPNVPDHGKSQAVYRELVEAARKELASARTEKETLAAQIKLSSALLLHAEFASRPQESLYTTANDHFHEGIALSEAIQDALSRDADLEKWISENPTLAMRWDALRVRIDNIRKKEETSRKNERQRLTELRNIVKEYRDVTAYVTQAMTEFVLESPSLAGEAVRNAQECFNEIEKIVQANRDYYLLAEEPDLDDPDPTITYMSLDPFTKECQSQLLALRALTAYHNAILDGNSWNNADLETALNLADQSVSRDAGNALGYYVRGVASEALALALTREAPADAKARAAAQTYFQAAQQHLKKAHELLATPKVAHGEDPFAGSVFVSTKQHCSWLAGSAKETVAVNAADWVDNARWHVLKDIQRRIDQLTRPDSFLQAADIHTRSGNTQKASEELRQGIQRHATPQLWYAWVEAERRRGAEAARLLAEFDQAVRSGMVPERDYRTVLVRGKVVLYDMLRRVATAPVEELPLETRRKLAAEIFGQREMLQAALASAPESAQAEMRALIALASAIRSVLLPDGVSERERKESFQSARDADEQLARYLATDPSHLDLREAMVLARLARGFLSVQLLPAYRDEAVTAFGAALDELAQLPFATSHVKILGAPLLDAMKRRPADAEQRVLAEERNWRRTLQGFNEGLLSLRFGESQSAVEKLIAAMNYVSRPDTISAPSSLPRAADMLREDDSSDLLLYYQGLLRSVFVLALVEHRHYDRAVLEAVRTLCPDKLPPGDEEIIRHIKPDLLQQAVAAIDSPFTGFALARALEEWVASHGPVSFPERDIYMQYARRALATCQRLFTSGMQSRFPQLFVLVQDTEQRLNNPGYFSDLANQFRSQNRLDDAFRILHDGVSRHLGAVALWEQLMQVAIDRADMARVDKQAKYREALQIAQQLPTEFVAPFMGAFWRGYIAEHLEDYDSARRAYSLAQSLARSEEERVRASARLALINLTLSTRNP